MCQFLWWSYAWGSPACWCHLLERERRDGLGPTERVASQAAGHRPECDGASIAAHSSQIEEVALNCRVRNQISRESQLKHSTTSTSRRRTWPLARNTTSPVATQTRSRHPHITATRDTGQGQRITRSKAHHLPKKATQSTTSATTIANSTTPRRKCRPLDVFGGDQERQVYHSPRRRLSEKQHVVFSAAWCQFGHWWQFC